MLSDLGEKLVRLHLEQDARCNGLEDFAFGGEGDCMVEKINGSRFRDEHLYINKNQYYDGLSEEMLGFQVGKYIVLRKWIDDRVGIRLTKDDIDHYMRIACIIKQSMLIINQIDSTLAFCINEKKV
jgi:hypothetical protein